MRVRSLAIVPLFLSFVVVASAPAWAAALRGGGQPVAAAMPATDAAVSLELRLDVPATASGGTQTVTITAQGQSGSVSLPVAIALAKELPAKLKVDTALPALRGPSRSSFEYQITIKNDAGRNLLVSL